MLKAKAWQTVGTNIANLGGELERNCKETSAACEEEWAKTGKEAGLLIWRIENFKVVEWPRERYGEFFDGDSYIVLSTKGSPDTGFTYDVHFWLGEETTADEAGTAAYKTVELDTYHKDLPVQHREVQGHESDLFLSYFEDKGGMRILSGGVESGFNHVEPENYKPRLLHVKGRINKTRVTQVPLSVSSLNAGDVFILDAGLMVYQWQGTSAGVAEKRKGGQLTQSIKDERESGTQSQVIEQGSEPAEFWEILGGEGEVADAESGGSDYDVKPEKALYRLSDASGKMEFTEEATGKIPRSKLDSDDVFVFDTGFEIFVWIGRGASPDEKAKGMGYAQDYMEEKGRPAWLPVTKILDGGENEVFESQFDC